MTCDEAPADSNVVTQSGPWTVLSCVTAACSRCGTVPLDEDTKLTPHFTDIDQAQGELTRDWGWTCVPRSNWPKDDALLCPACAADPGSLQEVSASSADTAWAPWWKALRPRGPSHGTTLWDQRALSDQRAKAEPNGA